MIGAHHWRPHALVKLRDAALAYIAAGGEARFVWRLIEEVGEMRIAEITQEFIDANARRLYRCTATAIRQWYVPIAAILHFAAKRGDCPYWQLKRPRIQSAVRLRFIYPEESVRLADNCAPHFRPTYLLAQLTGATPSEVVFIKRSQIDFAARTIEFPETETANQRVIPLHARVSRELQRLPLRDGLLFRRPDGLAYLRRESNESAAAAIRTAFNNACQRAGIVDFTFRDVRASFCVWRLATDAQADLLYELGGRDERMLEKYKALTAAELDRVRASLHSLGWDKDFLSGPEVRRQSEI
jgi:integrase